MLPGLKFVSPGVLCSNRKTMGSKPLTSAPNICLNFLLCSQLQFRQCRVFLKYNFISNIKNPSVHQKPFLAKKNIIFAVHRQSTLLNLFDQNEQHNFVSNDNNTLNQHFPHQMTYLSFNKFAAQIYYEHFHLGTIVTSCMNKN